MITFKLHTPEYHVLTAEGSTIARDGSHEFRFWSALSSTASTKASEVEAALGKEVLKVGQGKAMKNKWVRKDGDGFVRVVDQVVDTTQLELLQIRDTGAHPDEKLLADLRKRKLAEKK